MITHRSSVRRYRAELPQDRKVARVGALWRVRGGSQIKGERCLSLYIESIALRPSLRSLGKSMSPCRSPTRSDPTTSTTHIYLAVHADVARHQAPESWRAPLTARQGQPQHHVGYANPAKILLQMVQVLLMLWNLMPQLTD